MRGHGVVAWLVGGRADRQRFTAMHDRFRRQALYGVLMGGATAACATAYGWHLLLLVLAAVVTVRLGSALGPRVRVPELVDAAMFLALLLIQGAGVVLTGGVHSPLLPLMAVPVFTQAVFFRPAVTAAWTAAAGVTLLAAVAAATALPPVPDPPGWLRVVPPLVLLACLGPAARQLAHSDVAARDSASLDTLTGLYNRRALIDHFAQAVGAAQHPIGLVLVDIDHFKTVNDTHGHDRGDQVLRAVADRLAGAVRPGDLVHRTGGEEFVVVALGVGDTECLAIAERLREAVGSRPVSGLSITVSAGVSTTDLPATGLDALLRSADAALYAAKRAGRDQVQLAAHQD